MNLDLFFQALQEDLPSLEPNVDHIPVREALLSMDASWLRPVVELNARMHMGLVALALDRLVARGSVGLWRIVPREQLPARLPPLQMRPQGIHAGVLMTNDPDRAEAVVGVLAVAGTLAEAEALLALGGEDS